MAEAVLDADRSGCTKQPSEQFHKWLPSQPLLIAASSTAELTLRRSC